MTLAGTGASTKKTKNKQTDISAPWIHKDHFKSSTYLTVPNTLFLPRFTCAQLPEILFIFCHIWTRRTAIILPAIHLSLKSFIMPRVSWDTLPKNREKQAAYIRKIIESDPGKLIRDILQHDFQRDLAFKSHKYETDVQIHGIQNKIAGAIQQRGVVNYDSCDFCLRGKGLFVGCVNIEGLQYGRCANCVYEGQACSNADGKLCLRFRFPW